LTAQASLKHSELNTLAMPHVFNYDIGKFEQTHNLWLPPRRSKDVFKRQRNTEYVKYLIVLEGGLSTSKRQQRKNEERAAAKDRQIASFEEPDEPMCAAASVKSTRFASGADLEEKMGKTLSSRKFRTMTGAQGDADADDADYGFSDEQLATLLKKRLSLGRSMTDMADEDLDADDEEYGLSDSQLLTVMQRRASVKGPRAARLSIALGIDPAQLSAVMEKRKDNELLTEKELSLLAGKK